MKIGGKWTKKKWVAYTIATCSAVVLYMILSNLGNIFGVFSSIYGFIKPVVSGIIVAYIFNPLANVFNNKVFKNTKKEKVRWNVSVACTILVIIIAVVLLCVALIPQLADSVTTFGNNVEGYIATLQGMLRNFEKGDTTGLFSGQLNTIAGFTDNILAKISEAFSNNVGSVLTTSANIGKGMFDAIIAFILAIYLLLDKFRLKKAVSNFSALVMKTETHSNVAAFIDRCNTIIIRYISFDIIDGIIVGIVNFVFMLCTGMPYSVLISVIVGMTNLAPTFGPIVGALIGSFILVLVKPWMALAFIIFTVVLQTIDGYILKPRLFGESLGVSPLMILIAIVLGGRLFGVAGILLAIPFAAIIDFVWKDYVLKKLEERHSKQ